MFEVATSRRDLSHCYERIFIFHNPPKNNLEYSLGQNKMEQQTPCGRLTPTSPPPKIKDEPAQKITNHESLESRVLDLVVFVILVIWK